MSNKKNALVPNMVMGGLELRYCVGEGPLVEPCLDIEEDHMALWRASRDALELMI